MPNTGDPNLDGLITSLNNAVAPFQTYHIPSPPPPPPNGTTRDAKLWPFIGWPNMSITTGATFDTRPITSGDVRVSAANGYGVSVGGAGYPLVNQLPGEGHYSIYRDAFSADEYYGYNPSTGGWVNHMVTDVRGNGVGVGWDDAEQTSQLAGLARANDINVMKEFRHCLQIALPFDTLSNVPIFPAVSVDGYVSTNPNTGFAPYGCRCGIPNNPPPPASLTNPVDIMLWKGVALFGAVCADSTGAPGQGNKGVMAFRWEAAAGNVMPTAAGLSIIGSNMRLITNTSSVDGSMPGTPLDPRSVPAFA